MDMSDDDREAVRQANKKIKLSPDKVSFFKAFGRQVATIHFLYGSL